MSLGLLTLVLDDRGHPDVLQLLTILPTYIFAPTIHSLINTANSLLSSF